MQISIVGLDVLTDAWGDCQPMEQNIRILGTLPPIGKAHVLCHEALHLYSDVLGLNLPHPLHDSLSYVLMDLIQENPELIKFIVSVKE